MHKPGNTAIIKLKGNPENIEIWNNESYYDYWQEPANTYTGEIRYIAYK